MKNNTERDWCCGCYALTFTTGAVKGKSMIVQAHNTDYEMQDQNIFTFAVSTVREEMLCLGMCSNDSWNRSQEVTQVTPEHAQTNTKFQTQHSASWRLVSRH